MRPYGVRISRRDRVSSSRARIRTISIRSCRTPPRSTPSYPVATNLLRDFHLHPRPPHGNEFERDADSRERGENDDVGHSRRLRRLQRKRKRKGEKE